MADLAIDYRVRSMSESGSVQKRTSANVQAKSGTSIPDIP
jgi:hypothetical protein